MARGRFYQIRLLLLLLILLGAAAWGLRQLRLREGRRSWRNTVTVDVVLLRRGAVSEAALQGLSESLPRLERLFSEEFRRYRGQTMPPFSFESYGPVPVQAPPPELPDDAGPLTRVSHFLQLRSYFKQVEADGRLALRRHALRLYVVVEPVRTKVRFVEGFGAVDGDFGVVRAAIDGVTVDHALVAVGHEVLHCVGASDKYDTAGHTVAPEGLVEPALTPPYPQRFAEIMVGERPLAPGQGQMVEALHEVRIGPVTAMEIGWVNAP